MLRTGMQGRDDHRLVITEAAAPKEAEAADTTSHYQRSLQEFAQHLQSLRRYKSQLYPEILGMCLRDWEPSTFQT